MELIGFSDFLEKRLEKHQYSFSMDELIKSSVQMPQKNDDNQWNEKELEQLRMLKSSADLYAKI